MSLAKRYVRSVRVGRRAQRATKPTPLVLTLRSSTQWLRIIRDDPRVPVHLLPPGCAGDPAQTLFRSLHGAHRPAAEALARELLDTVKPRR